MNDLAPRIKRLTFKIRIPVQDVKDYFNTISEVIMGEVALVVQHDGKAVTTSLMVAEVFGKKHIEEGYGREQRRIAA